MTRCCLLSCPAPQNLSESIYWQLNLDAIIERYAKEEEALQLHLKKYLNGQDSPFEPLRENRHRNAWLRFENWKGILRQSADYQLNASLFRATVRQEGVTLEQIAQQTGLSLALLYSLYAGDGEYSVDSSLYEIAAFFDNPKMFHPLGEEFYDE